MVTVLLSKALICFSGLCYPALVGDNTPTGTYSMTQRYVTANGYGGDVIKFRQVGRDVYSIHRVWEGNPSQKRRQRLNSSKVSDRMSVSSGCINVDEKVYMMLLNELENDNSTLTIIP